MMIIGYFTTTPTDQFFGENDIDAFIRDIESLGEAVLCKEKRDNHETSSYPSVRYVIDHSDIIIGCPFTSPVIESLSMGRPAFWYDPFGRCSASLYYHTPMYRSGISGLTTGIKYWTSKTPNQIKIITRCFGHLTDPFCDGNAKDRVRDLIFESKNNIIQNGGFPS